MVSVHAKKSILGESHLPVVGAYHRRMGKKAIWRDWGARFRKHCRDKKINNVFLADKLEMSESGVRSWVNGNREINLSDFFRLCTAASVEPSQILFGINEDNFIAISLAWEQADEQGKQLLRIAAEAVKRKDESKQRGST